MTESAADAYFDTPERAERLALVTHLLHNTELVPCVRGPEGAGKSRFAERLAASLGEQRPVQLLDARLMPDIPAAISDHLGLPAEAWPAALLDAPEADGLTLLIDDADQLSEVQRTDLATLHEGGVRLVFFTAETATGPTGPWSVQAVDLPPFSEAQARDFLLMSGRVTVTPWTDAQWQQALLESGGQPGPLLALADAGGPAPAQGASAWKWVLGGGAALLVVLVLSQQERINGLFSPPAKQVPTVATAPEATGEAPADVADDADQLIAIPPLAPPEATVEPARQPQQAESDEPADAPTQAMVEAPALPADGGQPPAPDTAPSPDGSVEDGPGQIEPQTAVAHISRPAEPAAVEPPAPPQSAPVEQSTASPTATVAEPAPVSALPEPSHTPQPETPTPEPAAAPPKAPPASPPASKPQAAPKAPAAPPASTATKPPRQDDLAWLRSRQGSHYTLQLLGARDRGSLNTFIRRHRLTGKYAVFARDLGGKPWYSLVYGDYPDRAAAIRGRAALPAALRRDDVWPRTFASVWEQLPPPNGRR